MDTQETVSFSDFPSQIGEKLDYYIELLQSHGNTKDTPLLTDFPDIEGGSILRHFDLYWFSLIKILSSQKISISKGVSLR